MKKEEIGGEPMEKSAFAENVTVPELKDLIDDHCMEKCEKMVTIEQLGMDRFVEE
jgi:hypothetical protein